MGQADAVGPTSIEGSFFLVPYSDLVNLVTFTNDLDSFTHLHIYRPSLDVL